MFSNLNRYTNNLGAESFFLFSQILEGRSLNSTTLLQSHIRDPSSQIMETYTIRFIFYAYWVIACNSQLMVLRLLVVVYIVRRILHSSLLPVKNT